MILKNQFLLAAVFFFSLTGFAQQNSIVKKWVVSKIETPSGDPALEDLARQIKMLEITQKIDDHFYIGAVEYGRRPVITQPCSVIIIGKNINIEANGQKWLGEILDSGNDNMTCSLGSLVYHFKKVSIPGRRPPVAAKFTDMMLQGSWQETGRTDNNTNPIPIDPKDSIYLRISKDSAMYLPGAGYLPMFGSLDITKGDQLTLALTDFKLVSLTDQQMVLDSYENTIHSFRKTTLPYPFERKKYFMNSAAVDLSARSLIKNWFVYSIAPPQASLSKDAISAVNITGKNTNDTYSGTIEFGNWSLKDFQTLPAAFILNGNDMRIEAASHTWNGKIYKANGDTLIYGKENETMYYFRKHQKKNPPVIDTGTMLIDLRPAALISNWIVFNAEADPGFIKPETGILRGLYITNSTGNMKYEGKVIFDRFNTRITQDATIQFSGDLDKGSWISVETKDYNWNIEIFKADGKEMIMGKRSDGIRYYFQK